MDDESAGRLAKALIEDLDARSTYEGRLLTLVRALRHVEEVERARVGEQGTIGDLPGFTEISARLRAETSGNARSAAPREPPDPASVLMPRYGPHWSRLSRHDIDGMLEHAPGPVTALCRHLATLAAQAHLACQWGHFAEAVPILRCLCGLVGQLRELGEPEGEAAMALSCVQLFACVGMDAAAVPIPLTAAALARRAAADLGAIARASARMEGRPDLDPDFEAQPTDSVRGIDPAQARLAAEAIAEAIRRAPPPPPPKPAALEPGSPPKALASGRPGSTARMRTGRKG